MCAKWNSDYDISLLLKTIDDNVKPATPTGITMKDFSFQLSYLPTLVSAVVFDEEIPESLREDLVDTAITEAIVNRNVSPNYVRKAISKAERNYLRRPLQKFILVSSISLKGTLPFKELTIDRQRIVFGKSLPRIYDRSTILLEASKLFSVDLPDDYLPVRIFTEARSAYGAGEHALAALNLLLGIWNLLLTFGSKPIQLIGHPTRAAELITGPVHSLHFPSGEPVANFFWYEPTYTSKLRTKDLSKDADRLRKVTTKILRNLAQAPDETLLKRILRRYAAALDEPRQDTALIMLWSVLELLTDTQRDSYDKTIKRTAFLCREQIAKQELQHLRNLRNRLVHSGGPANEQQVAVGQLKRYVDHMLGFFLSQPNVKKPLKDITELLDLPHDVREINRRVALFRRAKKFCCS